MKNIFTILIGIMLFSPALVNAQGCMEPSSDGGVNVIGFIQPQYNLDIDGVNSAGTPIFFDNEEIKNKNSFSFNRARLGVTGNIPYDVSYYAMIEYSSFVGGVYLLDAFVTYDRFGPWAKFSLGQFKTPFSLELQTPCHKLHTVYRSLVVRQLVGPFRDLGFMASGSVSLKNYGSLTDHKFFSYQFGIMNGTGMNEWDNNNAKDFVFRGVFSPWKGINIGGSARYGKQKKYDKTNPDDAVRKTFGGEVAIDYFNFLFQGEYIYGFNQNTEGVAGGGCGGGGTPGIKDQLKRDGYYVMLLYKTPWNLQPVVKYESFNPKKWSNYDLPEGSPIETVSSITLGLNYFINDWSRVQVNYIIHNDGNVYSTYDPASETTDYYNNSLLVDHDGNYFKQQFVIQFQAVLQ